MLITCIANYRTLLPFCPAILRSQRHTYTLYEGLKNIVRGECKGNKNSHKLKQPLCYWLPKTFPHFPYINIPFKKWSMKAMLVWRYKRASGMGFACVWEGMGGRRRVLFDIFTMAINRVLMALVGLCYTRDKTQLKNPSDRVRQGGGWSHVFLQVCEIGTPYRLASHQQTGEERMYISY